MIRLARRTWDRLSIYFPIMLMAVLASGSYWLVRSTPDLEPDTPEHPLRKDPDYMMTNFAIKTFDTNGKLKSEVFGVKAKHYPHTDILEIEHIRLRSLNSSGQVTTATARRALANNDATEVQLIGDAQVVREASLDRSGNALPKVVFRSEFLHAFLAEERIKSHKPVELIRGNDSIQADSMDYSNLDQIMQMRGRVRGTLNSPARP